MPADARKLKEDAPEVSTDCRNRLIEREAGIARYPGWSHKLVAPLRYTRSPISSATLFLSMKTPTLRTYGSIR